MKAAGAFGNRLRGRRCAHLIAAFAAVIAALCGFGAQLVGAAVLPGGGPNVSGPAPVIRGESSDPAAQGATVSGQINPEGVATTYHIEYGTTPMYGHSQPVPDAPVGSDSAFHTVSQWIFNLQPLTIYHWRIVATNANGITVDGADQVFTTHGPDFTKRPGATTGAATAVTKTSATLNGTVNPKNVPTVYHFEYGTTTAYGNSAPSSDSFVGLDQSEHPEKQTISGLQPNTTYHFRIVATDLNGTTSGDDQTFVTTPLPPIAVTGNASAVTATRAALAGTVNPRSTTTTYRFEYGRTKAYGANAPAHDALAGSDATAHSEHQIIDGLTPSTTYHFRIVATSAGGTVPGADHTFRTGARAQPRLLTPALTRLSISPRSIKLSGRMTRHGCVQPSRANRHHRRCRRRLTLQVSYTLNVTSVVKLRVVRVTRGRMVGGHCVAQTRRKRSHRACTRLIVIPGTIERGSRAGITHFVWHGRIGPRSLGAGSYRLVVVATRGRRTSRPRSVAFVLRP